MISFDDVNEEELYIIVAEAQEILESDIAATSAKLKTIKKKQKHKKTPLPDGQGTKKGRK